MLWATPTGEDSAVQARYKPMGKNGYLARQKATIDVYRQAEKQTYIQFMTDTLMLTLNDPEIMGKDVFGKERIQKLVAAWGETFDAFHGALENGAEADYFQEKMDRGLEKILGKDGFQPFDKRYDWIKRQSY